MLNRITICGRMVKDPEMRMTQSGTPVTSFTLAVERDFANGTGAKETDFIDCVSFRSTAEFASKYFTKGSLTVASGRLQIRNWEDKEGNKRRNAEVVVDAMYFAERKRDDAAPEDHAATSHPESTQPSFSGGFTELTDSDDELPF